MDGSFSVLMQRSHTTLLNTIGVVRLFRMFIVPTFVINFMLCMTGAVHFMEMSWIKQKPKINVP